MPALKEMLEGRPVRSPLHPALVHLPIALFPLSLLLDIASWIAHDAGATLVQASFVSLLAGIATGVFAAVFGIVDYTDIRADHPAKKTATAHLVLNLIAIGLFAASAGLRYSSLGEPQTAAAPFIVSLIGVVILSYSGYLGGSLVYDDGIAVGRHRRRTRMPDSTLIIRTNGRPVAIGEESALKVGETVRVDVDGVIATVARLKGAVYAFQEFCPHRYGPLSEGTFSGCEVTCPWHGSRFDVRTGKVTAGPAKIDLRTLPAEIRDGQIWIHPPPKA
ncbi:MAG TPA: DUF2231 domain-containing protein [Opitutaceae bacterium]|nr:DUF2231 domain-containing protein [Opitutaceae bacterium]